MRFEDKFKEGDIICSDNFYCGKCVVVNHFDDKHYSCDDLVIENQQWSAYEFRNTWSERYTLPNNWRIATDDDIVNYLSRFINISLGKFSIYNATLIDDGIRFDDGYGNGVTLNAEDLARLGKIINDRIIRKSV